MAKNVRDKIESLILLKTGEEGRWNSKRNEYVLGCPISISLRGGPFSEFVAAMGPHMIMSYPLQYELDSDPLFREFHDDANNIL